MANLTISLDKSIISRARVRAFQEGTSVSAKVQEFIAQYVQEPVDKSAGHAFLDHAETSQANNQSASWSRDDAYDGKYRGASA